jgi:hypothetical protein
MTGELERIWKGAVLSLSRYYHGICVDRLKKTTNNDRYYYCVPFVMRTQHMQEVGFIGKASI